MSILGKRVMVFNTIGRKSPHLLLTHHPDQPGTAQGTNRVHPITICEVITTNSRIKTQQDNLVSSV